MGVNITTKGGCILKRKVIISLVLVFAMLLSVMSFVSVNAAKMPIGKIPKFQNSITIQYMKTTKTFDNPDAIPNFIVFQNYILRKSGDVKKLEINKNETIRCEKVFEDVYNIPDTITITYKGQQVTLTKKGQPVTKTAQEVTVNSDGSYTTKTVKYSVQIYEGSINVTNVVYMQDYAGYVIKDNKFHIFKN